MRTQLEEITHQTIKRGYRAAKRRFHWSVVALSQQFDPVIVKVGANDGLTSDPFRDLMANWRGVMIEPVPHCFARLRENFGDRFELENIAIDIWQGSVRFYYVEPSVIGLPAWVDGIGSFSREHVVRHLAKLGDYEQYIVETMVETDTLANVVERQKLDHITLLHIDTEGYDYTVWKSLDGKFQPQAIYIEHEHLKVDEREALVGELSQAYDILDCGSDYAALKKVAAARKLLDDGIDPIEAKRARVAL